MQKDSENNQDHRGYEEVPQLGTQPNHNPEHDKRLAEEHKKSSKKYPHLRLSNDEYVVLEVRRHHIGLFPIWSVVGIICVAIIALLPMYSLNMETVADAFAVSESSLLPPMILVVPMLFVIALVVIGGFVATYIYKNNHFYLTNESVIQMIQTSLFSKKEQHINLANIEDASYHQEGIIQHMFGYGTLRLSTQGEETIYSFYYVYNPRYVVQEVIEAMENATGHAARFRKNVIPAVKLGRF